MPARRRRVEFARKLFGLDPRDVWDALDDADDEIARLNDRLGERDEELRALAQQAGEQSTRVAELEARLASQEEEVVHLRERRAEVDEISARAQEDALRIIERAQREAEGLVERAQVEIEALRQQQRTHTMRAQRRLEMINGFRAGIRRSMQGSLNYVERAVIDMKAGLAELDSTALGPTSDEHEHSIASSDPVMTVATPPAMPPNVVVPPAPPVVAATPSGPPPELRDADRPSLRLVSDPATGELHSVPDIPDEEPQDEASADVAPEEPTRAPVVTLPEDGPVSPTQVVIEAHPIANYSRLAAFEQQIASLDVVTDVYVASFIDAVAELQVTLQHPVPLAAHLRRRIPDAATIDSEDPAHLRITMPRASETG